MVQDEGWSAGACDNHSLGMKEGGVWVRKSTMSGGEVRTGIQGTQEIEGMRQENLGSLAPWV